MGDENRDAMIKNFSEEINYNLIHGMCVSNVAYMIGQEMGLQKEKLNNLAVAGILHDIGKLKLSSKIYSIEKYKMQIDDMRYVRTHPTIGYVILKGQGYEDEVCTGVLYHHENYDGSGYPANLHGNNIPMIGRILRVSDVFAALISKRSYRDAFDVDTAIQLMIEEVAHFDMKVFLAFQRIVYTERFQNMLRELGFYE